MNDIKLELKKRAIHFYDEKAQELKTKLLQSLKGVCVCASVRAFATGAGICLWETEHLPPLACLSLQVLSLGVKN